MQALNRRFGGNTAHALDPAAVRVTLPNRYTNLASSGRAHVLGSPSVDPMKGKL